MSSALIVLHLLVVRAHKMYYIDKVLQTKIYYNAMLGPWVEP